MNIVAVICGLDKWEEYTLPAIQSIQKNDPALKIVVVDDGSDPKYPILPGVACRRYSETISYAASLNGGMFMADTLGKVDWYVLLNNDILLHKPITPRFDKLNPEVLYGFQYFNHPSAFPADYLASWCYFLSREIALNVGEFDENLKPMWFEDADYCIRVHNHGYKMGLLKSEDWGVEHLAKDRHGIIAQNSRARVQNRNYLLRKHNLCSQ